MTSNTSGQSPSISAATDIMRKPHHPMRHSDDKIWVDVIQHMENTYSELVRYQVELEEKNAALENAQYLRPLH